MFQLIILLYQMDLWENTILTLFIYQTKPHKP